MSGDGPVQRVHGDKSMHTRRSALRAVAIGAGAGATAGFASGFISAQRGPHAPELRLVNRQRFVDKIVLITGATSGIGEAASKMFAAEGARVAFCGRRADRGLQVEKSICAQGGETRCDRKPDSFLFFPIVQTGYWKRPAPVSNAAPVGKSRATAEGERAQHFRRGPANRVFGSKPFGQIHQDQHGYNTEGPAKALARLTL